MAGIASTRIASNSGVFHKPQANDAGPAGGADASSPFDQFLGVAATDPTAATGSDDQAAPDKSDSGKNAAKGKDLASDNHASEGQQGTAIIIAAVNAQTLIQAGAANDDSQGDSGTTGSGGDAALDPTSNDAATAPQTDPSSAPPATVDPSQIFAATQIPVPAQKDGQPIQTAGGKNGDLLASTAAGDASQVGALAQSALPVSVADSSDTGSDTSPISSDTSQASKTDNGRDGGKDVSAREGQKDPNAAAQADATAPVIPAAEADTAPSDDAPAPSTKKDSKSAKTQDQNPSTAADNQTMPAVPAAIAVAGATMPVPVSAPDPKSSDGIAAAGAAEPAKGTAKNNQANSNPPADARAPRIDPSAGNGSKSDPAQGAQPSPNGAAPQNGPTAQTGNGAQGTDSKPATTASEANDKQIAAAPTEPHIQAAQPAQPPALQAAAISPVQPQQTGAVSSVTQTVQVSQPDASSTANTVGALAVAIAAKSLSGNKQFDIRLDPPELGRVEVRLSIDATGKAEASLSADQPRTLDMLKTDAPVLTRALRDAGLNVSQNGLNFSLRGQDRQNGGNNFMPRGGRASQISLIATSAIGPLAGGAHYQAPADGRLDIRV